jgi:hypothetical protein
MAESRRTPFDDLDAYAVLTTAEIAARLHVGDDAFHPRRSLPDTASRRAAGG